MAGNAAVPRDRSALAPWMRAARVLGIALLAGLLGFGLGQLRSQRRQQALPDLGAAPAYRDFHN